MHIDVLLVYTCMHVVTCCHGFMFDLMLKKRRTFIHGLKVSTHSSSIHACIHAVLRIISNDAFCGAWVDGSAAGGCSSSEGRVLTLFHINLQL